MRLALQLAAIAALLAWSALGQQTAPQSTPGAAEVGFDPAITQRLRELRPDDPMAYFELAEDVAAREQHADGRRLARGLFVLAYELDRNSAAPIGLGTSVCLALATLADSTGEAQWLLEVGRALDRSPGPIMLPGLLSSTPGADAGARLFLAQAIGQGRDDEGKSTKAIISRAEVKPLVPATIAALGSAGRTLEVGETRPHCPGCAGRRFNRVTGEGASGLQPCPVCLGNPGLRLSAEQLLLSLSVEAALLDAEHHFWGAQLLADGGSPLREPDPSELARAYGVDPRRPYWRLGTGQVFSWNWSSAPEQAGGAQ